MSVIAWDGHTLAGDRRAVSCGLIRTTQKIFAVGDSLVAYAGNADAGEEVMAWYKAGATPETFPASQRNGDTWAGLMVIRPGGIIWKYERTPYPVKFPPQQFAIGSGRDFALAAMHCGKTAAEAVEIACLFDNGCGNGVDTLELPR